MSAGQEQQRRRRVLVTGAGGAAAVTLIQALQESYDVVAADMDPLAVGLYLVPPSQRAILLRGDSPAFAASLLTMAREFDVDLVVPTVDVELAAVAASAADFARHNIKVLVESQQTLAHCLDKFALMRLCEATVRVPQTLLLTDTTTDDEIAALGKQFIVKPRRGAGGRGFAIIDSAATLSTVPRDASYIAQEFLPGAEFSIDVLGRPEGGVVAAVPRRRDKVDSGIAVAGRTLADPALIAFGRAVAETIGVVGVVNVQARCAADGAPALLEVNPRFPGTMSLTRAAGIDMPLLAVGAIFGETLPSSIDFREVAVVRHWADVVVPVEDYPFQPPIRPEAT